MITSIKVQKGIFSTSLLITAAGLTASGKGGFGRWGKGGGGLGEIDALKKEDAEKIADIVRQGMQTAKQKATAGPNVIQQISIADELAKIAKLRDQGIITEEDFQRMKQDLMKKL